MRMLIAAFLVLVLIGCSDHKLTYDEWMKMPAWNENRQPFMLNFSREYLDGYPCVKIWRVTQDEADATWYRDTSGFYPIKVKP